MNIPFDRFRHPISKEGVTKVVSICNNGGKRGGVPTHTKVYLWGSHNLYFALRNNAVLEVILTENKQKTALDVSAC